MNKIIIIMIMLFLFFLFGYYEGKKDAETRNLKKDIATYQTIEKNTIEQAKTAEKIKKKYRDLKSEKKDCDYVLNFDVSRCLPK